MKLASRQFRDRCSVIGTMMTLFLVAGCGSGAASGTPSLAKARPASSATSGSAAAFYKGKTITWIVPYSAGGGFDTTARLVAPYLASATGARVVVENKPGAGGLVGVNDMAIAKPNGLTMALVNGPGSVAIAVAKQAGIKKAEGMHFDLKTLAWVGRITSKGEVLYVAPDSAFKTMQDVLRSKKPLSYGITGPGGSEYLVALIMESALGKQFKIIRGFKGTSGILAAVLRHEVELGSVSTDTASLKVKAGTIHALMVLSEQPYPFLPKVPTLLQIKHSVSNKGYALLNDFDRAVNATGRALATTPGTPPARVRFLSSALKKALSEPQLIAQAKRYGYLPAYVPGARELTLFDRATGNAAMRSMIVKSFASGK